MLQNLREHVQGWIAAVIASVLCLAFALWGVEYYISGNASQPAVATVNGFEITQNQVDTAYDRGRHSQQIHFSDPKTDEAYQKQLKQQALSGLIQTHVLAQATQKTGYTISPAQVSLTLQQTPTFQIDGHFSYPMFQRVLQNLSYTPEAFAQEIAQNNLLLQVQHSIADSSFSLPNEIDSHIALEHQARDFGYFLVSPTPFLAHITVKNQEIEDYYKSHPENFMRAEQARVEYLLLSTEEANKKISISDKALTQYLDENKAALQATLSQQHAPSTNLKSLAEKTLRQQKADQWIATETDKLANLTYTHPDTLKPAADALGLPIQTSDFFPKFGEKKGLFSLLHSKVLAAAFSDSVLKQGNNSDVIPIDAHTAIVFRISAHNPATPDPLANVRPAIEEYFKKVAAQQAATDLGKTIQQALNKGTAPEKIAAQYKLPWVQKKNVTRQDKNLSSDVLTFAFDQPPPSTHTLSFQGKALRKTGEYLVLAVEAVLPGSLADVDPAAKKLVQQTIENDLGTLDYNLYFSKQMNSAKIKLTTN